MKKIISRITDYLNEITWNNKDIWWHELVNKQSDECETEIMDSEDYAMIIFSSGTTGRPKGTVHTHGGALAQIAKELGYYFDVKENDIFFVNGTIDRTKSG